MSVTYIYSLKVTQLAKFARWVVTCINGQLINQLFPMFSMFKNTENATWTCFPDENKQYGGLRDTRRSKNLSHIVG